jgi:hypothetical protein
VLAPEPGERVGPQKMRTACLAGSTVIVAGPQDQLVSAGNDRREPLIPVSMANQPNNNPEQNREDRRDEAENLDTELEDQDPGERQKRNQGDQEEDPLAA